LYKKELEEKRIFISFTAGIATITVSVKLHLMQNQWNWCHLLSPTLLYIRVFQYSYNCFLLTC